MNEIKQKITDIVADYKIIFLDEYKAFVRQQIDVRNGNINEFAEIKGDNVLERKLFDTPANLYSMLVESLNQEQLKWFKSKVGGRWFAKNFKEFRASKKI